MAMELLSLAKAGVAVSSRAPRCARARALRFLDYSKYHASSHAARPMHHSHG